MFGGDGDQVAARPGLPPRNGAAARAAGRSRADPARPLGERLDKPQSWVHNCEVGNRRVDVSEFAAWATACGVEPATAFARFLRSSTPPSKPTRKTQRKSGSA
jgi:hypothetical protein